VVLLKRL